MQVDDETILGTTELENIVIKNGKNIKRSQKGFL